MPVNKRQAKLAFALPRLAQVLIIATNSVPARAPALRFWVWLDRKEQFPAENSSQGKGSRVKAPAGTGLTIRSSRVRFAASDHGSYD